MFCVKCGAQIQDDAIFCPKCGQKVGESVSSSSAGGGLNDMRVKTLLEAGRMSMQSGDNANAAKAYSEAYMYVPNNWECFFYKTWCSVQECKNGEIASKAQLFVNQLEPTLALIDKVEDTEKRLQAYTEVANKYTVLMSFFVDAATGFFRSTPLLASGTSSGILSTTESIYVNSAFDFGKQLQNRFRFSDKLPKLAADIYYACLNRYYLLNAFKGSCYDYMVASILTEYPNTQIPKKVRVKR